MAGTSRDKLVISDVGSGLVGFGDWAEQLIAESTGKNGVGVLPVVAEADAPDAGLADVLDVRLAPLDHEIDGSDRTCRRTGSWSPARSAASSCCGSTPPRSRAASWASAPSISQTWSPQRSPRALCSTPCQSPKPALFVDDGIEVRALGLDLSGVSNVAGAIAALESTLGDRGYVAVMAYLDREANPALPSVRSSIAARTARPTTFGWGPRFSALHRPTPQGRRAHRRLPADHGHVCRRSRDPGPSVHVSANSFPHKRRATPRCSRNMIGPCCVLTLTDASQVARRARAAEGLTRA